VEDIVNAALREDVDVVGLSILSGTHLSICEKVIRQMREKGIGHKMVVVGGVIPEHDMPRLREMGVKGIFPNGTTFDAIISFLKENLAGPR
jgi:methylmalonyl-CoA mutase C-terminal domain/subunit